MTEPVQESLSFRAAARRVVRRLFAAHWFRLLSRSAVVIFPAAALLAACLWYFDLAQINVWLAVALIPSWLTLTCLWAWIRRPTAESALAYWDQTTDRDEMFMSAYCFESQPTVDTGERLHLNLARKHLPSGSGKPVTGPAGTLSASSLDVAAGVSGADHSVLDAFDSGTAATANR